MHYRIFLLMTFGFLASCDTPAEPESNTIPGKLETTSYFIEKRLHRGWTLQVKYPDYTLQSMTYDEQNLRRVLYTRHVNFSCRRRNVVGDFHLFLSNNIEVWGFIECLNSFRTNVRTAVNLSSHFREADGRTVTGVTLAPTTFARRVGMDTALLDEYLAPGQSLNSEVTVDEEILIECQTEGEGTLTVYFALTDSPSSESFPLQCAPEHEQGSGG